MARTSRTLLFVIIAFVVITSGIVYFNSAFAQTTINISGTVDSCDPSNSVGPYEYQVITLETSGSYELTLIGATASTPEWWLYTNSFDPANPNTNLFAADIQNYDVFPGTGTFPLTFVIVMYQTAGTGGDWTIEAQGTTAGTAITLGASSINGGCPQLNITGSVDTCDPSNSVGRYEYQVITLETAGSYELNLIGATTTTPEWWLYSNSFDPANPSTNLLATDIQSFDVFPGTGAFPLTFVLVMYQTSGTGGGWTIEARGTTAGAAITLGASSINGGCASVNISGELDSCDPSNSVGRYEYQVITLETAGSYELTLIGATASTPEWWLYTNSFDPANPNTNLFAGDIGNLSVSPGTGTFPLTFVLVMYATPGTDGPWTIDVRALTPGAAFALNADNITLGCGDATNTATPSPTHTPTPTDTLEPTFTFTPTNTVDPSVTFTSTHTPTPTNTVDPSITFTPTNTLDPSFTLTPGPTSTLDLTALYTPPPPNCPYPLVNGSVQGRMIASTIALYEPNAGSRTEVIVPGGSSWWIIDTAPGFYKLWIACEAQPIWVSAFLMSPNYDLVWNGAPLPDAGP